MQQTLRLARACALLSNVALALGAWAGSCGTATGAVLQPYSLPSEQRPASQTALPQTAARPAISDSYYQGFAERAKTLKTDERAQLLRTFSQKRDDALRLGRVDEAQHYGHLVQILDAIK